MSPLKVNRPLGSSGRADEVHHRLAGIAPADDEQRVEHVGARARLYREPRADAHEGPPRRSCVLGLLQRCRSVAADREHRVGDACRGRQPRHLEVRERHREVEPLQALGPGRRAIEDRGPRPSDDRNHLSR